MKKLSLLGVSFLMLLTVGCSAQNTGSSDPVRQLSEQERQELGMTIHMCMMGGGENCDEYLDPANIAQYGDLVEEQCAMMPGMEACDVYFGEE